MEETPAPSGAGQKPAPPAVEFGREPSPASPVPPPDPQRGAGKCLGLLIIMALIYFWNYYCVLYVLPGVRDRFEQQKLVLSKQMEQMIAVGKKLEQQRFLGFVPVLFFMLCGIASLVTRAWGFFSGLYFSVIVLEFLLFLYGWLTFALPLIEMQKRAGGA